MYELMLDSAELDELRYGIKMWPVCGVTSNPSILKKEGNIDVYRRLGEIKQLCGDGRSLHVQVVSSATDDIINEAGKIRKALGDSVYIKATPHSSDGAIAPSGFSSDNTKRRRQ